MSDARLPPRDSIGLRVRVLEALGRSIQDNDLCVSHHIWGVRKVADAQHGFAVPLDERKILWTTGRVPRIQNENSRSPVNKADRQSPVTGPAIVPKITVKTAEPFPVRVIDEIKPNIFCKQVTYAVEVTRVEAFDVELEP